MYLLSIVESNGIGMEMTSASCHLHRSTFLLRRKYSLFLFVQFLRSIYLNAYNVSAANKEIHQLLLMNECALLLKTKKFIFSAKIEACTRIKTEVGNS